MVRDLSERHEPIGSAFRDFPSGEASETLRLTDQQLQFYADQGYVVGPQVLDETQADMLCAELGSFFDADHPGHELWYEYHANESNRSDEVLFHALGAWRIGVGFHDLLWNPRMLVPASQLLGGGVRFWHDQLFCKPARHGGVVAWHQDYSYWTRTRPLAHLTCWIGLDESRVDNGCIHYVPGSHKWDLLPITGLAGDMDAIAKVLTEDQWEAMQNPVAVELRRGQCVFHHPLTIHGSFENRSDRPRRAVVINLVRDGVRSDTHEPLLTGVPAIPPGQPLGGRFFPLLYE